MKIFGFNIGKKEVSNSTKFLNELNGYLDGKYKNLVKSVQVKDKGEEFDLKVFANDPRPLIGVGGKVSKKLAHYLSGVFGKTVKVTVEKV